MKNLSFFTVFLVLLILLMGSKPSNQEPQTGVTVQDTGKVIRWGNVTIKRDSTLNKQLNNYNRIKRLDTARSVKPQKTATPPQNKTPQHVPYYPDTTKTLFWGTHILKKDSVLSGFYHMYHAQFGDFDSIFKRRLIRVLLPYSRTLFFNDKGKECGISADMFRDLEIYLNQKYKTKLKNIPITVVLIPTSRDQLLTQLNAGMGDIAAGNLTVTEGRLRYVDFYTLNEEKELYEIPITQKGREKITTAEQLSGKTVHVRRSSSYYEHLLQFNAQLKTKGKAPVNIVTVSENLEDEDLMEMLDAGILSTIIVNRWKARMWAPVLPNIVLNESAAIHSGGHSGWATRKNSPKLIAELDAFYHKFEKPRNALPYRQKKYATRIKQLQDPTNSDNYNRYKQILRYFEKYGDKYEFDPIMLAALGFQESGLNQQVKSPVGAVGVMQLMPKTGASMRVGSIYVTENNIHAGTKYMNILMTKYFKDAHFSEFNRSLFAIASYNAGPGRVAGLRKTAALRGLNPDIWLNNVEIIASERIGRETTTYVRNILKYYYSYKLMKEMGNVQKQHRSTF